MKTITTTNARLDACPANGSPARFVAALLGLLLLALSQMGLFAVEVALNPGVAPVLIPAGGFAIDGGLLANAPIAYTNVGDWVAGSNGTGGHVLDLLGNPLNTNTTFAIKDLYDSNSDNVFQSAKFNQNPSNWVWTSSSALNKGEINNALVHLGRDAGGHIWGIIAGDRKSVSGAAYLDVEFLQNHLTMLPDGSFTTDANQNGRTTNDFVLSFNFNGGGSKPSLTFWQWQVVGSSYDYVDITSTITNDSTVQFYGADNAAGASIPFGAFGAQTYPDALQFVEAAVDLTTLVLHFSNPADKCADSLGIKTIFIKTKSSPANNAELKDLVTPIQVNLKLGPSVDPGQNQTNCAAPGATTTFTVPGTAQTGYADLKTLDWTLVSPTDQSVQITSGAHCDGCDALTATVVVNNPATTAATTVLLLTAVDLNNCTNTSTVTLTVNPPFNCAGSISGPQTIAAGSSGVTYTGPSGQSSYLWSLDNTTGITVKNSQYNQSSIVLDFAPNASDFNLTMTFTDSNGCQHSCPYSVSVLQFGSLCNMVGPDAVCAGSTGLQYTNTLPAGLPGPIINYWQIVNTGSTLATFATPPTADSTNVTINAGSIPGSFTVNVTTTYGGGYTAETCSFPTVVNPNPDCLISGPETICPLSVGNTYLYNGTNVIKAYSWSINGTQIGASSSVSVPAGACGAKFTLRLDVTDDNGCKSFCTLLVTANDLEAPKAPTAPGDVEGQCDSNIPAKSPLTATDNCDGTITVDPVDSGKVADTSGCGYTITRTWTFVDKCSNTSSVSQKIHIQDTTKPVAPAAPADFNGQCDGDVPTPIKLTATDNCDGTITVDPVDSGKVADTSGCGYTITRTWTFVDKCSNTSSVSQKIHIKDTTSPIVSCPPDINNGTSCTVALTLPISTTDQSITYTQFTGESGSASDNCNGVPTVSYKDTYINTNCPVSISRTFTVSDACGNATTCTQKISFNDTVAPTITCPQDQVVEGCDTAAKGISPPYSTAGSTISLDAFRLLGGAAGDNCSLQAGVAYIDILVTTTGCEKAKIKRTFTVKDVCGNPASCTQTITVQDTTPPVIDGTTLPTGGGNLGCTLPPNDTTIQGQVKATDNCSGTVTINVSHRDSTSGCNVTRTVAIWASDVCGNNSDTNTVTYTFILDSGNPVVGLPAHQAYYCPGDDIVLVPPSATDDCGVASIVVTVTNSAGTSIGNYGYDGSTWSPAWPTNNKFILSADTYTFVVVATDKCGNTGTEIFKINVLADCTAHCTFTQGFYGNSSKGKGKFTWMNNIYTKSGLVNALLGTDGITVGTVTTGNYLKIGPGEADCIDARLPAGGPSAAFTAGFEFSDPDTCKILVDAGPATSSIPMDKQGRKFRNNLLGQTITLALNVRLDPTLTVFRLKSASLCTLGSGGSISSYSIPASVLAKLGTNNTVQDLLNLANQALGGDPSLSGMLSDIGGAVDAINEAFDECSVAVPCGL